MQKKAPRERYERLNLRFKYSTRAFYREFSCKSSKRKKQDGCPAGTGICCAGERVALNVPRILSRCASRRTTQDALAKRAYANPATASQGEIPRTGHQKEKEKAGRLSCRYGTLLCGEKVALNVPHILSQCASRRTTQDALAERAYANPATASQGEIPRTGHQRKEKHHPNLGGVFFGDSYGNRTHVFSVRG